jgi:hypothetical protein
MSLNERMDKENMVHFHNGVLLNHFFNYIMKGIVKWKELKKKKKKNSSSIEVTPETKDKNVIYSLKKSGY